MDPPLSQRSHAHWSLGPARLHPCLPSFQSRNWHSNPSCYLNLKCKTTQRKPAVRGALMKYYLATKKGMRTCAEHRAPSQHYQRFPVQTSAIVARQLSTGFGGWTCPPAQGSPHAGTRATRASRTGKVPYPPGNRDEPKHSSTEARYEGTYHLYEMSRSASL